MEITQEQANIIIETRKPLGVFYVVDDGMYIGIDNSTGDAWVEEFGTKISCLEWLANTPEIV